MHHLRIWQTWKSIKQYRSEEDAPLHISSICLFLVLFSSRQTGKDSAVVGSNYGLISAPTPPLLPLLPSRRQGRTQTEWTHFIVMVGTAGNVFQCTPLHNIASACANTHAALGSCVYEFSYDSSCMKDECTWAGRRLKRFPGYSVAFALRWANMTACASAYISALIKFKQ